MFAETVDDVKLMRGMRCCLQYGLGMRQTPRWIIKGSADPSMRIARIRNPGEIVQKPTTRFLKPSKYQKEHTRALRILPETAEVPKPAQYTAKPSKHPLHRLTYSGKKKENKHNKGGRKKAMGKTQ